MCDLCRPVEPPLEQPATTTHTSIPELSPAPANPDVAAEGTASSGHGVDEAAQRSVPGPHGNENGGDFSDNKDSLTDQQPEEEEPKAGPSAPVVGAPSPEPPGPATSNTDEVAGRGVGGNTDGAGLSETVSQSGTPSELEDITNPSVQKSSAAEGHKSVVDKKPSGNGGHDSGFADDVPAMDPGFLAAFRQGSLGSQPEGGKRDDTP